MLGIIPFEQGINNLIAEAARKYNLPFELIKAVIRVESDFIPTATRYEENIKKTAYGLMQILYDTATWMLGDKSLTVNELMTPVVNINAGAKYLKYQYDRYNGNINKTIAAYNSGTVKISKTTGNFINQAYVDKVNRWMLVYKLPVETPYVITGIIVIGLGVWYFLNNRKT